MFRIRWDNGHATGWLPGTFDTEDAAISAAEEWHAEMVAIEPEADRAEAAEAYEWEVIELDD